MRRSRNHVAGESNDDIAVERTEGCEIYDERGDRYIDFTSGWCVGNGGWSDNRIRKAIREFDGPAYVQPGHSYAPWHELAALLAELTPGKLNRCYRATGGTEAVDIALQVAMAYTGRRKLISIEGCYHGNSIATRSIGDSESRDEIPNHLDSCLKLSPPLDESAISRLKTLLKNKDVAALIMEPIICNLGVLIPDDSFMSEARQLCTRYGTLLVIDEVATGFGRTGKLFGCEHFDIEPDIMCVAKAITGGYAPMGATIVTDEVADGAEDLEFYSTYGWHPLSVAAALANLGGLRAEGYELLQHSNDMGDLICERLYSMEFGGPVELRARGLAIGVELKNGADASAIEEACQEEGLLISAEENILTLFPPLVVDEELVEEGMDILEDCATRACAR